MFWVTDREIPSESLARELENHAAGAFVAFEGRVRKQNDGRAVDRLEYELFPELCVIEGERIIQEARSLFPILDLRVVHRYGELELGESAVWVGVLAAHRGAAFQACRFIIDAVKARCPIWKKESYVDGPSEWVGCASCEHHAVPAPKIFARQSRILGEDGQRRLKKSRVLVIGMGGLGCPVSLNLAAAGVGYLRLVDGDRLEASNLHRQTLYGYQDIGSYKSLLAKRRLEELHPFTKIDAITERFTQDNARELLKDIDFVVDGSDNFATKYLLNDICVAEGRPFLSASIYQNQAQLFSYSPNESSCLRCESPRQPPAGCVESCVDSGVLGAATSIVGSYQALESLRFLTGKNVLSLSHQIYLDLETLENFSVLRKVNADCPACQGSSHDFIYDEALLYPKSRNELSYEELMTLEGGRWIDLREDEERSQTIEGSLHFPLSGFHEDDLSPLKDRKLILYCQKGLRSRRLMQNLQDKGYANVYSLKDGIESMRN